MVLLLWSESQVRHCKYGITRNTVVVRRGGKDRLRLTNSYSAWLATVVNAIAVKTQEASRLTILLETLRVRGSPLLWENWQCRKSW